MPDYDTTSVANGVSEGVDQYVKAYQNGKIADSIVRVNPEMLSQLGMSKEQFGGLSAPDRTSAIAGAITAIGLKANAAKAQQDAALNQAQIQNLNSEGNARDFDSRYKMFMATASPDRSALGTLINGDSSTPPGSTVPPPQAAAPVPAPSASPASGASPMPSMSPQVLTAIGLPPQSSGPPPGVAPAPAALPPQPAATPAPAPLAPQQPNPALSSMNAALRTPFLTAEGASKIVNLTKERAEAAEALQRSPEGTQRELSDGSIMTSTGTGKPEFKQALHNVPPGVYNNTDGSQTISDGKFSPLRTLTPQEVRDKILPAKDRATFMQNATDLSNQLDEWIDTVNKYGNNPHNVTLPAKALATLRSAPLSMAQSYNKVIDPDVSNQQQKIEADAASFFPTGMFYPASSTTVAAAQRLQGIVAGRIRSVAAQLKELPPGLPPSMLAKVGNVPGATVASSAAATSTPNYKTPQEAIAAGAKSGDVVKVYNPATGKYQAYKLR